MPFIVRTETGYQDRDQYQISALYQPGAPWAPWDPQPQWNHKVLIVHGASCGVEHQTGTAPDTTAGGTVVDTGGTGEYALGQGFTTMSTALDNSGHNCNVALQAESLIMAKERIVEQYGEVRYTIGAGCSGGSLAIQWIANAYPGFYQGILPSCSFPDAWSTATQFLDYHLTLAYFLDPSKWGLGIVWLPTQMADVQGHISIVNSEVSDTAQFHVAVPTDPCAGSATRNATIRTPTRAAYAATSRMRRSTCSARVRQRTGRRTSKRSGAASPASRSTTSACSTACARCNRRRSPRRSSSISTRRSAVSTSTPP